MALSDETRQERELKRAIRAAEKSENKARADRAKAEKAFRQAERKAKNGNKASIARAERMREKMNAAREHAKQMSRERRAAAKPLRERQKQAAREKARQEKAQQRGRIFNPKPRQKSKQADVVFGETSLQELKQALKRLQRKVNDLYRKLQWYAITHPNTIDSPAAKFLDDTGGLISAAGTDYIKLYGEYLRAREFLQNPLSDVDKYAEWLKEIYERGSDFGEFIDDGLDETSETFEDDRNERIELYYDLFEKLCEMFPPFESDTEAHEKLSELVNAGYDFDSIYDTMVSYCTAAYAQDNGYHSNMHEFER